MKSIFLSRIRPNYLYFIASFLLLAPMLSLVFVWQTGQMQQAQLSLSDIFTVLQYRKEPLARRNSLLIDAVKKRGISFTLTSEIEKQLSNTGASSNLIEVIRQKSPKPPPPTPIPTPTVAPTPTPIPTPSAPDSAYYHKRGDEYVVKGEYDRAIFFYDEAILLNPKDAGAFYKRGFAYHYKNNHVRAFEDYKTAIQLKNELALQPMLQCALYNSTEDIPDKAIEECSKTISSASDFALAYYIRGNAYQNNNDADRAIADYNKFIEFYPKNVLVYINRGDAYSDKKDYDRAAADYNKAIELDAGNVLAKKNLLRLQAEKSNIPANKPEPSASSVKQNPAQNLNVGELNIRAVTISTPIYPADAKKFRVQGKVTVQINIDENGNVTSAKAISGNGLLRASAEAAARKSKFKPFIVNNQNVKATGSMEYNFKLP